MLLGLTFARTSWELGPNRYHKGSWPGLRFCVCTRPPLAGHVNSACVSSMVVSVPPSHPKCLCDTASNPGPPLASVGPIALRGRGDFWVHQGWRLHNASRQRNGVNKLCELFTRLKSSVYPESVWDVKLYTLCSRDRGPWKWYPDGRNVPVIFGSIPPGGVKFVITPAQEAIRLGWCAGLSAQFWIITSEISDVMRGMHSVAETNLAAPR